MPFKRILFIFLIFLALLTSARANECGIWFDNFTSPLCTDASYIFYTGVAITAGLYWSKKDTVDNIREQSLQKKPLRRFSKIGEIIGWGYLNGLYTLMSYGFGVGYNSKKAKQNAEFMAEASLYTLLATWAMKETIHEPRPDGSDEYDSFPSGHASESFAFASVVAANHAWYWGILSHGVALYISYSRIQDDRHFLHDVVAGATVGMSYAWGIYFNHKKYRKPYWFAVLPTEDMQGMAGTLAYSF